MKQNKPFAVLIALGLSACGSIGDGNGPVSMELALAGETDAGEVFECLATTAQANVTFTNGSSADYARQATWTSSDESVLRVSNGDIEAQDGSFFTPGVLLPVSEGVVELSAEFLGFEDSIVVAVRPSRIELAPAAYQLVQGRSVVMVATGVLDGTDSLQAQDLSLLGEWSVAAADGGDASSSIDAAAGVLSANAGVSGTDTVSFAIDFCQRSASVDVEVVNQTLQSIELVRQDAQGEALSAISLPPDASTALRVIGHFSGGREIDLTASSSFSIDDSSLAFTGLRGSGVVTASADDAARGQTTQLSATYDPDSSVEGDEFVSNAVSVQVLDVALDPASLSISPADGLMVHGSTLQYSATGEFTGNDGPVTWDLSRDVSWLSGDNSLVFVSNSNGSRGLAISTGETASVGATSVSALRLFGDGPDTAPSVDLTIGAATDADPLLQVLSLSVEADADSLTQGESLVLRAIGEIGNGDLSGSQDLSSRVIWSSSDDSIARVSNASATRGQVVILSDVADQQVVITARYQPESQQGEVSGDIQLNVNPTP